MRCPHYEAPYCDAHDYDHVLERREAEEVGLPDFSAAAQDAHWEARGISPDPREFLTEEQWREWDR